MPLLVAPLRKDCARLVRIRGATSWTDETAPRLDNMQPSEGSERALLTKPSVHEVRAAKLQSIHDASCGSCVWFLQSERLY
eukprot:908674-Amphidinium_carterae.1